MRLSEFIAFLDSVMGTLATMTSSVVTKLQPLLASWNICLMSPVEIFLVFPDFFLADSFEGFSALNLITLLLSSFLGKKHSIFIQVPFAFYFVLNYGA
jgi:hypothetical protein